MNILTADLEKDNRLDVRIGDVKVTCLVDSGAAVSVIGRNFFDMIKSKVTSYQRQLHSAVSADGTVLNVTE